MNYLVSWLNPHADNDLGVWPVTKKYPFIEHDSLDNPDKSIVEAQIVL